MQNTIRIRFNKNIYNNFEQIHTEKLKVIYPRVEGMLVMCLKFRKQS